MELNPIFFPRELYAVRMRQSGKKMLATTKTAICYKAKDDGRCVCARTGTRLHMHRMNWRAHILMNMLASQGLFAAYTAPFLRWD